MTGPEHYREAERLLVGQPTSAIIATAQVHATLALAAATGIDGGFFEVTAWDRVAGTDHNVESCAPGHCGARRR